MIVIKEQQYECLREHLNQAIEIFNSLVVAGGDAPGVPKKTRKDKVMEFDKLISIKGKAGKPEYLKKKK